MKKAILLPLIINIATLFFIRVLESSGGRENLFTPFLALLLIIGLGLSQTILALLLFFIDNKTSTRQTRLMHLLVHLVLNFATIGFGLQFV